MTLLVYSRSGGFPPPDDEALTVEDDGGYVLVRTNGAPRVGRFTGRLDGEGLEHLRALASAARAVGSARGSMIPDAAPEDLVVGDQRVTFGGSPPDGAWGELVRQVRRLVNDLAQADGAGLVLKPGSDRARLLVSGDEAQAVDVGRLVGEAVTFTPAGALDERVPLRPDPGGGHGTTLAPGQFVDLPYGRTLTPAEGGRLQVEVRVPGRRDGKPVLYRLLAVRQT